MQEYINELQQKVGLTAEQAKQAIETIVNKVKSKVPESLHGSIDSIFSGQGASGAGAAFQEKAQAFSSQAEEKLKEFGSQAKEQLNDFAGKAEDLADEVQQKAEEMVKNLGDKLSGFFDKKTPPAEK
jgi:hypothetical protein